MNGRELAPDGWTPHRGSVIVLLPAQGRPAPPGRWKVLDRAPDGWWCCPVDSPARDWAVANVTQMLSGCLTLDGQAGVPGRRMLPAYLQMAVDL